MPEHRAGRRTMLDDTAHPGCSCGCCHRMDNRIATSTESRDRLVPPTLTRRAGRRLHCHSRRDAHASIDPWSISTKRREIVRDRPRASSPARDVPGVPPCLGELVARARPGGDHLAGFIEERMLLLGPSAAFARQTPDMTTRPRGQEPMTEALHCSRMIYLSLAQIISATVLAQAGCTKPDEAPAQTCVDPSPTCQAVCGFEDTWPQLIGCTRTLPLQNEFVNMVSSKTCHEWREVLQPVSGIPLVISPERIGITPIIKDPCHY